MEQFKDDRWAQQSAEAALFPVQSPILNSAPPATQPTETAHVTTTAPISAKEAVAKAELEINKLRKLLPVTSIYLRRLEYADMLWNLISQRSEQEICETLTTQGVSTTNRLLMREAATLSVSELKPVGSALAEPLETTTRNWLISRADAKAQTDETTMQRPLANYLNHPTHSMLAPPWKSMWMGILKFCLRDDSTMLRATFRQASSSLGRTCEELKNCTDNSTHQKICAPFIANLETLLAELITAEKHIKSMASFSREDVGADCAPIASLKACCEQVPTHLQNLLRSIETEQAQLPTLPQEERIAAAEIPSLETALLAEFMNDLGFTEPEIRKWANQNIESQLNLLLSADSQVLQHLKSTQGSLEPLLSRPPEELSMALDDATLELLRAEEAANREIQLDGHEHTPTTEQAISPAEAPRPGLADRDRIAELLGASQSFSNSSHVDLKLAAAVLLFGFQWRGNLYLSYTSLHCIESEMNNSLKAMGVEVGTISQKDIEKQLKIFCRHNMVIPGMNNTYQLCHSGRNRLAEELAGAISVVLRHYKVKSGMASSAPAPD